MATTSPDNLRTPDPGDPYNLVPDLATLAGDVQTALNKRSITPGTVAQRTAFTASATAGWLWQDTDGMKMLWRKDGAVWVPAVWRWSGTNSEMTAFSAPNGFEWFNVTDGNTYLRVGGAWTGTGIFIATRNATPGTVGTAYTNVGGTPYWSTQSSHPSVTATSDGWTLQPGTYNISAAASVTTAGLVLGLSTATTPAAPTDFIVYQTSTSAQGLSGCSVNTLVTFSSATTVKLVGVATASATLRPSEGRISITKV